MNHESHDSESVTPVNSVNQVSVIERQRDSSVVAPAALAGGVVISVSFVIPPTDQPAFASLPEAVRSDIRRTLAALRTIHAAPKIKPACVAAAAQFHGARGFSAVSIRAKYYEYLRTGDWRCLIDKARAGRNFTKPAQNSEELPAAFVDFWRGLCERNQRKSRAARRTLLLIWRTHHDSAGKYHKSIPGYAEWPKADPQSGHPRGWSEANLYRCAPSKFELTATRIGRRAAGEFRPQVLTTRVGLRVGQYLLFDDQEYDVKINFPGQPKAMRPLGLNSLDLFSAALFAYSFKPTLWSQEEQAKQKLKLIDMVWFVVHVLSSYGFRDDDAGTVLVVEHGTAAISEEFEQRIFDATHGRVRVDRSGIQGNPSFDGLFEGAAKGNFRFKAALESIFNLVRNEMAMLPGNVGLDRNHSPEELHGRDRYNNSLIRAALALPAERAQLLRLPFLDWQQFTGLCLDIYARINARIDHDLEGWTRAGLITSEWRINETTPWMPQDKFLALPAPEQAIMRQLIEASPSLTRARKLSPIEVFSAGQRDLQKVQGFLLPVLLGSEFGVEQPVKKNGMFEFEDSAISPDPLRFLARIDNRQLPVGEKYLTFLNPFNPVELILCDAKAAYIGTCKAWDTPCRSDLDAIHRQMGQVRAIEAELLAPIARRGAELTREKLEQHRHNAAVLAQAKRDGLVGQRIAPAPEAPAPDCTSDFLSRSETPITEDQY